MLRISSDYRYLIYVILGRIHHGEPMAQRYKKSEVNDIGNSNNSIIFIEEELITKDLK